MAFNKAPLIHIVIGCAGVLSSCNYSFDNYQPTPAGQYSLSISDLVIETPTTAEVVGSDFRLTKTSTVDYGCSYDSAGADTGTNGKSIVNANPFSSTTERTSVEVTVPATMSIQAVKMRLKSSTTLSGYVLVDISTSSGGTPSATILSTSNNVDISTLSIGATGSLINFPLPTPLSLPSGTSISLILKPDQGVALTGLNNFGLLSTNDTNGADGTACSNFTIYKRSTDSGSTWNDGNNSGHRKGYFFITADIHSASGSGYWSIQATDSVTWDMTSFSSNEAPNQMGGSITYDVGVSEDATPVFTQTGLSKSQVQALTGVKGKYLFLRVNLSSQAPYYERPEVNTVSISSLAH